jgi:hypothetical protein
MRFLRHDGIYRSDVFFVSLGWGNGANWRGNGKTTWT